MSVSTAPSLQKSQEAKTDVNESRRIDEFLREEFPALENQKLAIRPLWGRFYRLNMYEAQESDTSIFADSRIVNSWFVQVVIDGDKISHKIKNAE